MGIKMTEKPNTNKSQSKEPQVSQAEYQAMLDAMAKQLVTQRDAAFRANELNNDIYTYLCDYFQIDYDPSLLHSGRKINKFYSSLNSVLQRYITSFIRNAYPRETKNFEFQVTNDMVDSMSSLYSDSNKEDVRHQLSVIFSEISNSVRREIDNSGFHDILPIIVSHYFVCHGAFLCMPSRPVLGAKSAIDLIPILPAELALVFSNKQEIVQAFYKYSDKQQNESGAPIKPNKTICVSRKEQQDPETGISSYYWEQAIIDEQNNIIDIQNHPYNPIVVFYNVKFPYESMGRGVAFEQYRSIKEFDEFSKHANHSKRYFANPPIALDSTSINGFSSKDLRTLEPGDVLIMNNPSLPIKQLNTTDPTPYINDANNQRIEITECILGSIINQNPATTATLTNEQVTSQQNFILQQLGRGAKQLIEQIVMNSFHILLQKGIIHETIRNFLLEDSNRLPYFLFNQMENANAATQESLINGFINAIVSLLAQPTGLHISITSPLGLAFKGAQYSRLVEGVTRISQLTQLPVNVLFNTNKLVNILADYSDLPPEILSSEKERNAKIQQMMQQQVNQA